MEKKIWVKQTSGTAQLKPTQKATLRALGLKRIGSQNWISDSKAVRGMLNRVHHLIEADLVDAKAADAAKKARASHKRGYTLG